MKKYKKQTGIWLDYKEAFLVIMDEEKGGEPELKHLRSHIEWGVPKGGSRSKTPYGPQGGVNERSFTDRRHHAEKAYFDAVIREIDPATDELVLFGLAEAKYGLQNVIESIKHFHPKLVGVFPAEAMSENQLKAKVRDFFANKVIPEPLP